LASSGLIPAPLWRPFHRLGVYAVLKDADLEPLAYQPQDAGIGDPVLDHPHQPLVVDRVVGKGDRLPIAIMPRIG